MAETVFRNQSTATTAQPPKLEVPEVKGTPIDDHVEVPYLDDKNFLDTYFGIGSEWHDVDAKFYPEVEKIDTYIKSKIEDGEIANDKTAVKDLLKGMEKMNNLKGESRSVVKLEVLANYVEFLMKNQTLKSNLKRYTR